MNLSTDTLLELNTYFSEKRYTSKAEMIRGTRLQIDKMLCDCGFVYVSENGQVIHKDRYCGYGSLVHIDQAINHGDSKICKKCAVGTNVEDLFWERMSTRKEK